MRNIIFSPTSRSHVTQYNRRYREYYEELYRDSGIWAEDQIIEGYIREANYREEEIYTLIEKRL